MALDDSFRHQSQLYRQFAMMTPSIQPPRSFPIPIRLQNVMTNKDKYAREINPGVL